MQITPTPTIALQKTATSADENKGQILEKACKDFEGIILKQMLTTMRKSIPESGLFNSSFATETYQSMSDDQLAQSLANSNRNGMGFGEALYRQLSGQNKIVTKP